MLGTKDEAEKDGVVVPLTLQEYCVSSAPKTESDPINEVDFYDDDYGDDCDDDDDDNMYYDDDDDSGNEES